MFDPTSEFNLGSTTKIEQSPQSDNCDHQLSVRVVIYLPAAKVSLPHTWWASSDCRNSSQPDRKCESEF